MYKELVEQHGSKAAAARAFRSAEYPNGMPVNTFKSRYDAESLLTDEQIEKCKELGIKPEHFDGGWITPRGASFRFTIPKNEADIEALISGAIADRLADCPVKYEARPHVGGNHLLVVDLADVHIGKLCVRSETGFEYTREIARHRVIEGTRALLAKARLHGVGHILFVTGNDILHVDSPKGGTTSGTPQDTCGSLDQMYSDAQSCLTDAIEMCAEVAPVDLLHCPSNHDWQNGWALAQTLQAWFRQHPDVRATNYNVSKRHRKYYRYGGNLIGLSHGDGAKEAELPNLMLVEARDHIGECLHTYWYLHHFHHGIRKSAGANPIQRLKENTAMTVMRSGNGRFEGDGPEIEYVHSPSPPDGWHDRNGYVNRQGVDCFLHDAELGRVASFTEWF